MLYVMQPLKDAAPKLRENCYRLLLLSLFMLRVWFWSVYDSVMFTLILVDSGLVY